MKRGGILGCLVVAFIATLMGAGQAFAHDLPPDQVANVGFDQRLGQRVPLDLLFRDENGVSTRLGDYFDGRPVILSLNYFHCQNLCPLELDGLMNGLNGIPFTLGQEFTLITVSIDPREGPADAQDIKSRTLRGYDKAAEGVRGWHVLTADQTAIDRLTDAVGFRYAYDPVQDDYAHPAGVVVLTPSGQISRYLYGLDFSANDLRLALVDATTERIGTFVDRALLVCYHYDPLTGRYTLFAWNFVRAGGAVGLVCVLVFLGWLWRGEFRSRSTG
ncbi:MAG: SCO family protein [Mycobacterium sp.]|nr:SCO family protein [Mycobacterium sp.]